SASTPVRLLDFDLAAGLFELTLELVGLLAVDALLDGLRRAVDERLGLLEAETRGGAHRLDDLNLLVARSGEDDVHGGRLLLAFAIARGASAGGRRSRGNGGRGHAE